MKITKKEKIWLGLSLLFLALYYMPGLPEYLDSKGLLIHAALTLIPFFLISWVGNVMINKLYKLKDEKISLKANKE